MTPRFNTVQHGSTRFMRCDVPASGAIELYFYGEMEERERALLAQHLAGCAECRDALEELSVIRTALAARPDVSAPASGDWSPFMARLDASVARDVSGAQGSSPAISVIAAPSVTRPAHIGYLAMAALLALVMTGVLFVARSRNSAPEYAAMPIEPTIVRPQADPDLAAAGERHLERSKLVVLGMATKDAQKPVDWDYERELAGTLLNDTRLYRLTAEQRGMTRLAEVLRDLEIVLLQTSLTQDRDPAALEQIQRLIRKRDLVEQMGYATSEGN